MSHARFHRPKQDPKFIIDSNNYGFSVTISRCGVYKSDYDDFITNNKSTSFIFEKDAATSQLSSKITKEGFNAEAD